MNGMMPRMDYKIFAGFTNTTAYHLGRYSLHLLLLKSSMVKWSAFVPSMHSDDPSSNPDDDKIIFKLATSFSD